jgi:hypothetical protein
LEPGVQVDLWRQPKRKDVPGWQSPATLIDIDAGINAGNLKWQGPYMSIPLRHMRVHVGSAQAYLASMILYSQRKPSA